MIRGISSLTIFARSLALKRSLIEIVSLEGCDIQPATEKSEVLDDEARNHRGDRSIYIGCIASERLSPDGAEPPFQR
jgi:hypothetical protein